MWSYMLDDALIRINSLQTYYFAVIDKYENRLKEEAKRCRFAVDVKGFLHMYLRQESLTEEQKKVFSQVQEEFGKYIDIPEQNQNDSSVLYYQIVHKEELENMGYCTDIDDAYKAFQDAIDKYEILNSSTLIMLITRFEEYIADFMHELFGKYPSRYLDKIQIPFSDVQASSDFNNLKKKIISQRVDEFMRESFKEWFKVFNEHKLNYDTYFHDMKALTEIYARRNIWTHNCGIVNDSYLSLVDVPKYKIGEKTIINREYITSAFEIIKKILFVVSIEACKMSDKEEAPEQIAQIFKMAFTAMADQEYAVCIPAFECIKEQKHTSLDYKYMSMVNIWISEKAQAGLSSCKTAIEEFDTSALHEKFQLAKLLLLDNNEEATTLLRALLNKKDIDFYCVQNWPLFMEYRKTSFYEDVKKEFGNSYTAEDLDTTTAVCVDSTIQLIEDSTMTDSPIDSIDQN